MCVCIYVHVAAVSYFVNGQPGRRLYPRIKFFFRFRRKRLRTPPPYHVYEVHEKTFPVTSVHRPRTQYVR